MSRHYFAGTPADWVFSRSGNSPVLVPGSAVNFYSAKTAGTHYTDLLDKNGSAATQVTAESDGSIAEFRGPDGVTEMWADAGGTRVKLVATDASATYAPLDATETVVRVPAPTGSNDTSAIATALALAMSTGRDLVFQSGTYKSDKITWTPGSAAESISWRGAGRNLTTIEKRTADGNDLLQINANPGTFYVSGFSVEGITFKGSAGNTPHAVLASDAVRCQFRDCAFTSSLTGFQAQGGIGIHWDDCSFDGNVNGLIADKYTSFAGYPNLNVLSASEITNNTGWGVKFDGGRGFAITDCDIEGNGTNGTPDSGGLWVGTAVGSEDGTTVIGVTCQRTWFEANAGGAVVSLGSGRNKLDSCYMAANPNATNDLKVTGGRYVMIDCDIDTAKATSINDTTSASPNYILNTDIAGGVTIDATKTYYDQGGWTSYTPTVGGSGWAIGNGTVIGKYRQIGKLIHFWVQFTWGSTSTFGASASPTVNYPIAMAATQTPTLTAEANDVGSNVYMLYPSAFSTGRCRIFVIGASGAAATLTATVPFTWGTGDVLTVSGTYEPA